MALFVYVLIGLVITSCFLLVPKIFIQSKWMFSFFLIIGWFPLFLLGIVLIAMSEPETFIQ